MMKSSISSMIYLLNTVAASAVAGPLIATGSREHTPVILKNRLFGTRNFWTFYYHWHTRLTSVKRYTNLNLDTLVGV